MDTSQRCSSHQPQQDNNTNTNNSYNNNNINNNNAGLLNVDNTELTRDQIYVVFQNRIFLRTITLVNVYVDLLVFTHIAGTS